MNTSNLFSKCIFCEKCPKSKDFLGMINKALYVKFAASQNYYYCKDVNEILSTTRNKISIKFKDQQTFDEEDEYLKRYYDAKEIKGKLTILTEYYKFHKDVPRIFMYSIARIMNYYHDKKRKIEYIRITKIIKEKNEQLHNKKGKKEKNLNEGRLFEEKSEKTETNNNATSLKNNYLKILQDIDLTEEKQQNVEEIKNNNISGVTTVIELQKKLSDIITDKLANEKSDLYTNEESFAKTFDNSSFLKFLSNLEKNGNEMKKLSKLKKSISEQKNNNNNPKMTVEKENTLVMKKVLIQNFNIAIEKPNSAFDHKNKLSDPSFKQKDFLFKEKENNNFSVKNSPGIPNKIKTEIKSSFLPFKKTEKLLRKVSANRKSADLNYLDKNTLIQKNLVTPKNSNNQNYGFYSQTEANQDEFKLEIKPSHTRIFSTFEGSLQKANYGANNYSKMRLIKNNSLSKKNTSNIVNNNNSKNTIIANYEEKKNMDFGKKTTQQHKYTKSDVNVGKIMNLGSPKTNKELKYFYKVKNLSTFKNCGNKNLNICTSRKNVLENKSNDEMFSSNLISPKLNQLDSYKDKSSKFFAF